MSKLEKSSGPWHDGIDFESLSPISAMNDRAVVNGTRARKYFFNNMHRIDETVDDMVYAVTHYPDTGTFLSRIGVVLKEYNSMLDEMKRFYPDAFRTIVPALRQFTHEYFDAVASSINEMTMHSVVLDLSTRIDERMEPHFQGEFSRILQKSMGRLVRDIPLLQNDQNPILNLLLMFRDGHYPEPQHEMEDETPWPQQETQSESTDFDEDEERRSYQERDLAMPPMDEPTWSQQETQLERRGDDPWSRQETQPEPLDENVERVAWINIPARMGRARGGRMGRRERVNAANEELRRRPIPDNSLLINADGAGPLQEDTVAYVLNEVDPPSFELPTTPDPLLARSFGARTGLQLTRYFDKYMKLFEFYKQEFDSVLPNFNEIKEEARALLDQYDRINHPDFTHSEERDAVSAIVDEIPVLSFDINDANNDFLNTWSQDFNRCQSQSGGSPVVRVKKALKRLIRRYLEITDKYDLDDFDRQARIKMSVLNASIEQRRGLREKYNIGKVDDKFDGRVVSINDKNLYGSFVSLQQSGKNGDELSKEISKFKSQFSNVTLGRTEKRRIGTALNGLIDGFTKTNRLTEGVAKSLKL